MESTSYLHQLVLLLGAGPVARACAEEHEPVALAVDTFLDGAKDAHFKIIDHCEQCTRVTQERLERAWAAHAGLQEWANTHVEIVTASLELVVAHAPEDLSLSAPSQVEPPFLTMATHTSPWLHPPYHEKRS